MTVLDTDNTDMSCCSVFEDNSGADKRPLPSNTPPKTGHNTKTKAQSASLRRYSHQAWQELSVRFALSFKAAVQLE